MTILDILSEISIKLRNSQIENYQLEANSLISFVCKLDPSFIISHPEKKISKQQEKEIKKLAKLRCQGWPLAYLIKNKNFYQLNFIVSPDVLVPRPESELIVENVISDIKGKASIVDIGTGSACLIISLANVLKNNKTINYYGLDISSKALKIARKNAKLHHLDKIIKFYQSNLLQKLINQIKKETKEYFILANLPYLTKEEIKQSPSIQKEPKKALDGGKDGLALYQKLFDQIKKINNNSQFNIYAEINPWQEKKILALAKKAFSECLIETKIILDLKQETRLIIFRVKR